MFVPTGSYEGTDGTYFQALCVRGGDVTDDQNCFCAGIETPGVGGADSCSATGAGMAGMDFCWTAPGTCADGTPGSDLGLAWPNGINYEASLMACTEENTRNEDCSPTAVYPILIPCMEALADVSNFCTSDCHVMLRPWVDQCMNGMDPGVEAMMQAPIEAMDACGPPPPMGDEMAPCCQGCQDGCGGYKSRTARSTCGTPGCANTNQEEPDFIDPECLDEGHTRVVRGDTMGVCDSNGFTDYDGQPCSRDCEDHCPDPARALVVRPQPTG
jgi:hypothetical protein